MHKLKLAAFHVSYICISKSNYFVSNLYYHSSLVSRNWFVWDRHDLNHEYLMPLMPQEFHLGSKLLRPTIWHVFIGSKNIIIEFMPISEKKGVLCALTNIQYCCQRLRTAVFRKVQCPSFTSLKKFVKIRIRYKVLRTLRNRKL
jgi:hypothetical protein